MPFVGEVVPLSLQMLDGDATKFVRATATQPDGTPLAGSPFSMPYIGNGKYSSDGLTMPNFDYIEVTYESFNDALFTIPDPDHLFGTDNFKLEIPDSVILAKLEEILAKLNGLALPGAAIDAHLVQNRIKEVIVDVQIAKALLEHDDVTAAITLDQETKGLVSDQKIKGNVNC